MQTLKWWLTNRVVLGVLVFMIAVGAYEFHYKPQYRPFYEAGVAAYQARNYNAAMAQFQKAYDVAPNSVDVIMMVGWTHLKLHHYEEARYYFTRAVKIDPRIEEAQIGLSFVALETGRGTLDEQLIRRILGSRNNDPNILILLAGALQKQGRYFDAVKIYNRLADDKNYGNAARAALVDMFGLDGFSGDTAPSGLAPIKKAADLQLPFKSGEGAIWKRDAGGGFAKFYLQGVNFGAAAPGYSPGELPNTGTLYTPWMTEIADLHANAVRLYTLLPPAFYRAYSHYVQGGGTVSLVQQIWVGDPPNRDLFDTQFVENTKADIRHTVDAIHGHGLVPPSPTHAAGVYEFDVASHVAGFMVGRELEADLVAQTNVINAGQHSYNGKYISLPSGSATDVWLAQMADYLIEYETNTYNWQHPVAIFSGPAPQPQSGEVLEYKLKQQPAFSAGLFAAYPAFPYYPEYLQKLPQYVTARDAQGPNPVLGFVRDLRNRLPYPLVVSEYGISSSAQARYLSALGWNQGGNSEEQQAELLTRLARGVRDGGAAGGFAYELMDEWHRRGWLLEGFASPPDRSMLWLNDVDPAARYGLVGYRTSKEQLFAGDPAAWSKEQQLYSGSSAGSGDYTGEATLRDLRVTSDEAYLYIRLEVGCLDCVGSKHDGALHLDKLSYAFALNTLPGKAGIQKMPFDGVRLDSGANFLLLLSGSGTSKLLISDNYNPLRMVQRPDDASKQQVIYRQEFAPALKEYGSFQEVMLEKTNSLSQFPMADPKSTTPEHDSRAAWWADIKHNAIMIRIPWAKLLVTDPSSGRVLFGYTASDGVISIPSAGIQVSVYALLSEGSADVGRLNVAAAMPSSGSPKVYSWTKWDKVNLQPYQKKAYAALQQEFQTAANSAQGKPQTRSGAARAKRVQ